MSGGLKIARLDSPLTRSTQPDPPPADPVPPAAVASGPQAPPLGEATRQIATRIPTSLVRELDTLAIEIRQAAGITASELPMQDVLGALVWDAVAAGPAEVGERVQTYRAARHEATAAAMRRP